MKVRLEFKPQDLWVGVFWQRETVGSAGGLFGYDVDAWVCLIPMLPLHISWHYGDWREGDDDEMCPNCVTPWKCNGPHLLAVRGADREAGGE